jgi:hypothetical protein
MGDCEDKKVDEATPPALRYGAKSEIICDSFSMLQNNPHLKDAKVGDRVTCPLSHHRFTVKKCPGGGGRGIAFDGREGASCIPKGTLILPLWGILQSRSSVGNDRLPYGVLVSNKILLPNEAALPLVVQCSGFLVNEPPTSVKYNVKLVFEAVVEADGGRATRSMPVWRTTKRVTSGQWICGLYRSGGGRQRFQKGPSGTESPAVAKTSVWATCALCMKSVTGNRLARHIKGCRLNKQQENGFLK